MTKPPPRPAELVLCISCGSEMQYTFPFIYRCPKCKTGWSPTDSFPDAVPRSGR